MEFTKGRTVVWPRIIYAFLFLRSSSNKRFRQMRICNKHTEQRDLCFCLELHTIEWIFNFFIFPISCSLSNFIILSLTVQLANAFDTLFVSFVSKRKHKHTNTQDIRLECCSGQKINTRNHSRICLFFVCVIFVPTHRKNLFSIIS